MLHERLAALQARLGEKQRGCGAAAEAGAERRSQRKRIKSVRLEELNDHGSSGGGGAGARSAKAEVKAEIVETEGEEEAAPAERMEMDGALAHASAPAPADVPDSDWGWLVGSGPVDVRAALLTTAGGAVRVRLRVARPIDAAPLDIAPLFERELERRREDAAAAARVAASLRRAEEKAAARGLPKRAGAAAGAAAVGDDGARTRRASSSGAKRSAAGADARGAPSESRARAKPSSGAHGGGSGTRADAEIQRELSELTPAAAEEARALLATPISELNGFTEGELKQLRLSTLTLLVRRLGLRGIPKHGYSSAYKAARAIKDRLYRDRIKSAGEAGATAVGATGASASAFTGQSRDELARVNARLVNARAALKRAHFDGEDDEAAAAEVARFERARVRLVAAGTGGRGAVETPRGGASGGGSAETAMLIDEGALLAEGGLASGSFGGLPVWRVRSFVLTELVATLPGEAEGIASLSELLHTRGRPPAGLAARGITLEGAVLPPDGVRTAAMARAFGARASAAVRVRTSSVLEVITVSLAPVAIRARTAAGWFDLRAPADAFRRALLQTAGASRSAPLDESALAGIGAVPRAVRLNPLVPPGGAELIAACARCSWVRHVSVRGPDGTPVPLSELWEALRPRKGRSAPAGAPASADTTADFTIIGLVALDGGDVDAVAPSAAAKAGGDGDGGAAGVTADGARAGTAAVPGASADAADGAAGLCGAWVRICGLAGAMICTGAQPGGGAGPADIRATGVMLCVRTAGGSLYALASPSAEYRGYFACPGHVRPAAGAGAGAGGGGAPTAGADAFDVGALSAPAPPPLLDSDLALGARDPPGAHWRLHRYTVTTTSGGSRGAGSGGSGGTPGGEGGCTPLFRAIRELTAAQKGAAASNARVTLIGELELRVAEGSARGTPVGASSGARCVRVRVALQDVMRVTVDWGTFVTALLSAGSTSAGAPAGVPSTFVRTAVGTVAALGAPHATQAAAGAAEAAALSAVAEVVRLLLNYDSKTKVPCGFVAAQAAKTVATSAGKADLVAHLEQHRLALRELRACAARLAPAAPSAATAAASAGEKAADASRATARAKLCANVQQFAAYLEAERAKRRGVQPPPSAAAAGGGPTSAAAGAARPSCRPAAASGAVDDSLHPPPRGRGPANAVGGASASGRAPAAGTATVKAKPASAQPPRLKTPNVAAARFAASAGAPAAVPAPKPAPKPTTDAQPAAAAARVKKRVVMGLGQPTGAVADGGSGGTPTTPATPTAPAAPAAVPCIAAGIANPTSGAGGETLDPTAGVGGAGAAVGAAGAAGEKRGRPLSAGPAKPKPARVVIGIVSAPSQPPIAAAGADGAAAGAGGGGAAAAAGDGDGADGVAKFVDCGVCAACLDKPKFGGNGLLKQRCIRKQKGKARRRKGEGALHDGDEADAAGGDAADDDSSDEPLSKKLKHNAPAPPRAPSPPHRAATDDGPTPARAPLGEAAASPARPDPSPIEQAIIRVLDEACMPRSVRQIATALRKESNEGEETAGAWEARIDAALRPGSLANPRVHAGDGLVWLQD